MRSGFISSSLVVLGFLIFASFATPAVADNNVCKRIEGISFCFPGVMSSPGISCPATCTYCGRMDSFTESEMVCNDYEQICSEGVCKPGRCLEEICQENRINCSNDIKRGPPPDPSGCTCPDPEPGYTLCDGKTCGSSSSCP